MRSEGRHADRIDSFAQKDPPQDRRSVGLVLLALIALVGVLGYLAIPYHDQPSSWWRFVDLDRELNLPTLISGALLMASSFFLWQLIQGGMLGNWGKILVIIFAGMALDEWLKIHETSEKITGIDWQITYIPIIICAAIGWTYIWIRVSGWTRALWFLGAAAWFSSQILETIQWGGINSFAAEEEAKAGWYSTMMFCEEMLEVVGSAFFLLALLRFRDPRARAS